MGCLRAKGYLRTNLLSFKKQIALACVSGIISSWVIQCHSHQPRFIICCLSVWLINSFNKLLVSIVAISLYPAILFPVFSFCSGSSRRGAWMLNINLLLSCETSQSSFYWNKHMNQWGIKNNDIFIRPFLEYLYPFFLWLHSMTSHRNPLWVFFCKENTHCDVRVLCTWVHVCGFIAVLFVLVLIWWWLDDFDVLYCHGFSSYHQARIIATAVWFKLRCSSMYKQTQTQAQTQRAKESVCS